MKRCLLFDCDGTLVDSELLNCEAMAAELLQSGIDEAANGLLQRYRGWKFSSVLDDLQQRHSLVLDKQFTVRFRQRASVHLEKHLKPIEYIPEVLAQINQPMCVASNAPMEKIQLALRVTGLDLFFGNFVFSAYEVNSWKPEPGLFLHAAHAMGFDPAQCVVIEDTTVGVSAAVAAGIDVVHYEPDGTAASNDHVRVIKSMDQLPSALGEFI